MKKVCFGIFLFVCASFFQPEVASATDELQKVEDNLTINAPWEQTCNREKGVCSWAPFRTTKSCERWSDC